MESIVFPLVTSSAGRTEFSISIRLPHSVIPGHHPTRRWIENKMRRQLFNLIYREFDFLWRVAPPPELDPPGPISSSEVTSGNTINKNHFFLIFDVTMNTANFPTNRDMLKRVVANVERKLQFEGPIMYQRIRQGVPANIRNMEQDSESSEDHEFWKFLFSLA